MPSIETEPRNMDALELLQTLAAKTDSFLKQWLDSRHGVPNILMESIQYSLFGPGKRVRPVLALLSCQAVGGHIKQALPAAGALELIHCFSLTHDDLPAMDNDDLRRGRPTNHKVYGETVAILTGDAMNTMAFELLVEKVTDPVLAASLVGELATATGPAGMIGGQILDICHPRENPNGAQKASLEKLQRIHRMKTGALIAAACRMGALCGGADEQTMRIVDTLGRAIGLAFQIVDDLLDVTATDQQLGKRTGKDARIGKLTYPSFLGVEETRRHLRMQQEIAEKMAKKLGRAANPLALVVQTLANRDR